MPHILIQFGIMGIMLVGLPLLGIHFKGVSPGPYLQFPPETRSLDHEPFSWPAFIACGVCLVAVVIPILARWLRSGPGAAAFKNRRQFPWWGWVGLVTGAVAWILAWTRLPWFSPLQPHTFTPLWLSYILVINAIAYFRLGRCMMMDRPRFFAALFPVSALFWWFFEYLNRFVQNWYYVGTDFDAWQYFWYATLPFSTVLPAVLGTRELILGSDRFQRVFGSVWAVHPSHPRMIAWLALLVSAAGLAGIGVWPGYLFPLLWVSPILIMVSLQQLMGMPHVLQGVVRGDWRLLISSAVAALICGIFWEMWNYFSLAKWNYSIPLVHRYPIFEMPVLGYGGYLPFGVECAVIGDIVRRLCGRTAPVVEAGPQGVSP
jgi:hypothetical protein